MASSAQCSHSPRLEQNALDVGLRLLMLRRFSRPNRPRERVSFELESAATK
jgi:hypothetical protein